MTAAPQREFWVSAIDADGKIVSGLRRAASPDEVVGALRTEGQRPIEIKPAAQSNRLMALLNTEITASNAMRPRARVAFTQSLAALIDAGVPLDNALSITADLAEEKAHRQLATRLLGRMQEGSGLADAMSDEGHAFPPVYMGIVRAAEASGRLGPALARLAVMEEAVGKRQAALRAAMIYPAFLTFTAVICITVLMIYVVPSFTPMLENAGQQVPPLTRGVIATAEAMRSVGPALLPLLLLLVGAAQLALRRPGTRVLWHHALLRLPLIGPLRQKLASAAFARIFGELLAGGVDLRRALRLSRDGMGDFALRAETDAALPRIEAGERPADVFRKSRALAPMTRQMMDVGSRSGKLAEMLIKSADMLDDEVRRRLDALIALFTPVVTLLMGGVIALIVTSILFALFSLNELATG
ncbi:MAG: type II secretion system F family protein [Pseudomonadota bacterium]